MTDLQRICAELGPKARIIIRARPAARMGHTLYRAWFAQAPGKWHFNPEAALVSAYEAWQATKDDGL